MNFLELCQRVRQECGGQGLGPTAVTGQTGSNKRYVDWTATAWMTIQNMRSNWRFLWREFEFNTTAAFGDYNPDAADVAWWSNFASAYLTADGVSDTLPLRFREYEEWRHLYERGYPSLVNDRPQEFTILPNNYLRLTPKPDDIYTIVGDRQLRPQIMVANDDVPAIDLRHHEIIVWRAMMHYGGFEDAPEVNRRGKLEFDTAMIAFKRDYLPMIEDGTTAVGEGA